ncbi:VOC family protein [Streptomyces albireticuli]|uniref:Glyoxalase/bleomycin resistance/dioxygenase family protein n=1 Tax=Streptomyces albireticuli TaxID=1940 RepID=A0A2A2DAX6_9ACTN|nr:VOC family protein [Streptomyces albireticuli]MCD9145385.1 VOC family protein [Streptomyces albireticuli]MCD9165050.1 VOC family protein [Streptomyces albireticuli]MCD9195359.1 VOC family protein [Streptomyces albireticuli]PAU49643.1 glyoxalase/bleomycin resistance/dioxygenase family protein [Streptomyces albireticuli]
MKAPAIAPCLGVKDTGASVGFYEKLGFTALPAGDDPNDDIRSLLFGDAFALMVYRDAHLRDWLPVLKDTPVGAFGMFYLAVDDFDAYVAGIRPLVDAVKEGTHDGQPIFYFADPDGYVIGVVQKREW